MVWQHSPYAVPLVFVALVLVSFAIYAWQYRVNRATTLFIIYMAAIAILLLAYAGEYSSADLRTQMIWARLEYVSTFLPGIWLLFVLSYTRRIQGVSPLLLGMVFLVPAVNSILVWTNHIHHLIWADVRTYTIDPLMYFQRVYGEAAILGQIVETLTGLASLVILALELRRGISTYRKQILLLFGAAFLPLAGYLINVAGVDPFPPLRLAAIGFALACIPIGYSLFRFQLLDILPAAYDLIVTSMKDAVVVVNTRQFIVYANPAAEQVIARPAGRLVGQTVEEAFRNTPKIIDHLLEMYDSSTEVTFREGPEQAVYDLIVSPLRSRNGRLAGRVVVLHDITRQKQAEQAAARAADRLGERNRMLDTYSHTVAHDLKSPLHIVLGYVDMLKLEMPDDAAPQVKSYLDLVSEAAINMAQMIDNLLLLARLDDIQTVTEVVDVQPVAEAAVNNLKGHIQTRTIDIQVDESLPPVVGYAPWLAHVFSNLLGNAVKYIGKDNKTPRIMIRGSARDGVARFEVEDNGLGIAPDDQRALFDKFSRFHKTEASGSGLGLTIVDMIIQRLGGRLGVTSEPGHGSIFWFELPSPERRADQPVADPLEAGRAQSAG